MLSVYNKTIISEQLILQQDHQGSSILDHYFAVATSNAQLALHVPLRAHSHALRPESETIQA